MHIIVIRIGNIPAIAEIHGPTLYLFKARRGIKKERAEISALN